MNAVTTTEANAVQVQQPDLLTVIARAAADPTIDLDKMDRLLAMQERIMAKTAEQSFNSALSNAQSKMRPVAADANNPQTRSKYASYAKLDGALRPIYTDHGFALSFDTGMDAPPDSVRVLCHVSHNAGHSRTYHVDMPSDGKGAKGGDVMTKTHAVGAGMSYGMRYLLKMIFNVAVGEDDNDGNKTEDFDDTDWRVKIDDCKTMDELNAVRGELRDAKGIPPRALAGLKRAWGQKARAL